jgi:general secretion pathway protein L
VTAVRSPCYIGATWTSPSEPGEGQPLKYSLGAIVLDGHACLLCLRLGAGRAEVAGAFRAPLPAGPDEEPAFVEALSAFLIASRIPAGARVTLGVPRREFILRRFETPPVKAGNLPALVGFEMDRHLPGRREDFLCGWRVAGRTEAGGYLVLLGAARKSAVDHASAVLRRANLAPVSIQPESFALADLLRRAAGKGGDALLVDLGRGEVGLDFIRDGHPALSWIVPVEEPHWRDAPPAHPPAAGVVSGAVPPIQEAAQRLGASLAERLTSPLFRASSPGDELPDVYLGGYGANRSRLIESLQSGLGKPLRTFTPWPLVRWADPPDDLTPYTSSLALAFAGAHAKDAVLELDPGRQEELHRAPSLRLTVVLALLLVAVLATYLGAVGLRQQRRLALADREIRTLKTAMARVDHANRLVQRQRLQRDYLRSMVSGRARPPRILLELTGLLPDSAYLTELTYKERTVEITGLAPSASQLLPVLEASPLFSGVEFSAPIVAQGAGLERFRIRLRLEAPGG